MKFIADSGLWTSGPQLAPTPLVAVLEVSGAVLSWGIADSPDAAVIAFTDPSRADWLWRVLGESGHGAVAAALAGRTPNGAQSIEVAGVGPQSGSLDQLCRLALGHWLRRWWPASHRDGIAAFDPALLDAEIALLTAAAQDFFPDDTFDSDVSGLLTPHAGALEALVRGGDPRVVELVRAASELTDDVGIAVAEPVPASARRDDYALAAGSEVRHGATGAIARGTGSLAWGGVPPGVFDAAEDGVDWRVEAAPTGVNAVVGVQLLDTASPNGIAVRLLSGDIAGAGVLDDNGRTSFPLVDPQLLPISESVAWNHDWQATEADIGASVNESPQTRETVRAFARARLASPPGDAFLAEVLAAEADY